MKTTAALVAFALSITPTFAYSHMCWVDAVTISESGIRVMFSNAPSRFSIKRADKTDSFYRNSQNKFQQVDIKGQVFGPIIEGLNLGIDDEAMTDFLPEDGCKMDVEVQNSKVGLMLHPWYYGPGQPSQPVTEFVTASGQ